MAIFLDHLRLSLIWTDTFFDLLADGGPAGSPMGFLGRASTYASRFAALPPPDTEAKGLSVPWPRPAGQYFWTYYLEGKRPGDLTGDQAWNVGVPFRGPEPARVSSDALKRRVLLEAFHYPHGIALVATLTFEDSLELDAAVQRVFKMRRSIVCDVQWDAETGRAPELATLAQAADGILAVLRHGALGKQVPPAAHAVEPFSVLTVIGATGTSAKEGMVDGSALHRAFEAMASWMPGYEAANLPAIKDATIETRTGPAGVDVLYARPRGRVVWFGRLLDPPNKGDHTLACYHRNLTFLSLQIEALGSFARATATALDDPGSLSAAHLDCARRSAGLLGRLYGGTSDVYRSWSPRKHIDQNALIDPINKVRDVFGMAPLA
jgi:hypothetical protein